MVENSAQDIPPVEGTFERVVAGNPTLDLPLEGNFTRVFAFVDVEHPVVAWGVYRGVLVSANAEHTPPNCPVSMMFAGIVLNQNNVRLHNELLIEKYRQLHFSHCNSRLTGMYFFEDHHSAERAYEWGSHFSPENLTEMLLFSSAPVSRHDANWITFAPLENNGKLRNEDWIYQYWSGESFPGKEPVWEIIAQGRAVICGAEIRLRAYKTIFSKFPESVRLLEIGRIAAHLGSDLGLMAAWLIRQVDGSVNLTFHIDMRDANQPKFLDRLRLYKGPRNDTDLAVGGDYFGIPHFSECKCQFDVTDDFLFSVHRNA